MSAETAGWAGEWADGLVTINQPRETLERVLAAFREGGGEGKPVFLQVHLSWAGSEQEALDIAYDQWRTNLFQPPIPWDLHTVEAFDEAARFVRPEDVRTPACSSPPTSGSTPRGCRSSRELGFDAIYLHHVGQEPEAFIDAFGERVLPELR